MNSIEKSIEGKIAGSQFQTYEKEGEQKIAQNSEFKNLDSEARTKFGSDNVDKFEKVAENGINQRLNNAFGGSNSNN
ncbi:uncharacterized protein SCDLUD_001134 [Saccharomycodes ludwigii]|uniref:uncharacterized protein n=1 Tax=Saccharomycodes ludwigii TaxID=36035 RepID=UPI001E85B8AB|nr:hypothetical protein SCDLUD_001134 [Saccharomycodes ludwigii]KAH3903494.1 hypothetical protein SCDLUD_001134 [Saccharomycodes ludwigii]